MKKLFYTLILCFFALNLSADIYFVSDEKDFASLSIEDDESGESIPVSVCSNAGTGYTYVYKISNLPSYSIDLILKFTTNNNYLTDNSELKNNSVYKVYKNNGRIVLLNIGNNTFDIKIDMTIPAGGSNEAFLGITPNFCHSVSINGHVATYKFFSALNPNGATIFFPQRIFTLNGKLSEKTEGGIEFNSLTTGSALHWSPRLDLQNDGRHRYTTTDSRITVIKDLVINRNATDSKEISSTYLNPANQQFGSITYNTTYTKAQVANWIFFSVPFDAKISVRISGYGNIPLTYTNDPNKGYTGPCYLLRSFDSQKRANGQAYWTEVKSTTLTANKGYILGIDPRSTTGNIIVTYTSVNNYNIRMNQPEITFNKYTGTFDKGQNQHLSGTGLMFKTASIQNTSHGTQSPFSIALPNNGNWTYEILYNQTKNIVLDPFSAYLFQGYGALVFNDRGFIAQQQAPRLNETTKSSFELYDFLLSSEHYNSKTTIFMCENGSDFLYFTEDVDGNPYANQFYSFDQEFACAHNHCTNENQTISLGGRIETAGEYTISLQGIDTKAKSVLLTDTYDGSTAELTLEDYTFTASENENIDNRFVITFSFAPEVPVDTYVPTANQIIVSGNAANCNINNLTVGETVMIFDATGRIVYNQTAQSENINITLISGTYIVRQNNKWAKFAIK